MSDIFDFWAGVPGHARIHPADQPIFKRMEGGHVFDLECLPIPMSGPLKTAPVVLLYANPGLSPADLELASSRAYADRAAKRRTGTLPFSASNEVSAHKAGGDWIRSRLGFLGDWELVRQKVAVLNLVAYHSKGFSDRHMVALLPSSRAAIEWTQQILFPSAEAGERVLICMRATKEWGLHPGRQYGRSLFAPFTVRSGFARSDCDVGNAAKRAAQDAVKRAAKGSNSA